MDDKFKKLFNLAKKDDALTLYAGDDLTMGSIAPYGISSGIAELDLYLGRQGGLPASKVIEYYGKQMCLSESTHINYHVRDASGKVQNGKGGTLENLYRRFHKLPATKRGEYQRSQTEDSYFTAPSMKEDNTIVHNKIMDVVKTGRKGCFLVTTKSGETIQSTAEHKFHDGLGYRPLSELKVGDTVLVHNNTVAGKGCTIQSEASRKLRLYVYVQNHPIARTKVVNNRYEYKVISLARAVVEADMNGLTLSQYKDRLNKSDNFEGMKFIPKEMHVHHIDENYRNDDRDNLVVLTHSQHLKLHAKNSGVKFEAVFDEISSIVPVGECDTYDLKMESPYHNYVANRFVVSNCGKTTAALQAAAEWQKRGGLVIFIDTEDSYTPKRARELGCNPENIFKHKASTIEEIFKILIHYLGDIDVETKKKSKKGLLDDVKDPVLFIVDSVTGVPTIADAQGDIDASDRPGFEAKQIKRGLKKVNPMLSEVDCKPSIIFINHAISKIGGFGKTSDSGGGLGIKFYANVRVEFTHLGQIKNTTTKQRMGQKIKICIEKLKGAHLEWPDMTAELTNEIGFDKFESLKLAMIATGFAERPKGAQTVTILPGTPHELQIKQTNFREWVEERGYDEVYLNWRRWCIREGCLEPWGSEE